MTIDLSQEFRDFDGDWFASDLDRQRYILETVLTACAGVVQASLDWLSDQPGPGWVLDGFSQATLESFLHLGLADKLIDRERLKVGRQTILQQTLDLWTKEQLEDGHQIVRRLQQARALSRKRTEAAQAAELES